MHSTVSLLRAMAVAGVVAPLPLTLLAQDDDSAWNHFGLDYRIGLNVQAKFSEHPAGYINGFVKPDSSGNSGATWNWGYQSAAQISGNNLLLSKASFPGSQNDTDDPQMGFELNYVRDLDHEDWGGWGIKFAFGYTDISVKNNGPINGSLLSDSYSLGGITAPLAPYAGSFNGPGPVISSTPNGSPSSTPATITGSRSLDANLYELHTGPTIDWNISRRFTLEAGGGLALGIVDSTFKYNETITSALGSTPLSGSTSDTGFDAGFYLETGLAYRLCQSTSLYGGVQYEYLDSFNQSYAGQGAELDLSASVYFVLGLEFHF